MDYDNEDYPPFKLSTMHNMKLVWEVLSHGDGMFAVQVRERINHLKSERRTSHRPIPAKEMKKLLDGGHWTLLTVQRCMWSLRALRWIEKAVCEMHPDCGRYHVEGWVVTPSSKGLEFPDPDECWDIYEQALDSFPPARE